MGGSVKRPETPRGTLPGHPPPVFGTLSETLSPKLRFGVFMGSEHPSHNVKTLCNFELQIWPEIIISRDAESTCFKGWRMSCDVIVSGLFLPNFGRKNLITWWMHPADFKAFSSKRGVWFTVKGPRRGGGWFGSGPRENPRGGSLPRGGARAGRVSMGSFFFFFFRSEAPFWQCKTLDVLYFFLFWSPSLAADTQGAWVRFIYLLAARKLALNFPLFLLDSHREDL